MSWLNSKLCLNTLSACEGFTYPGSQFQHCDLETSRTPDLINLATQDVVECLHWEIWGDAMEVVSLRDRGGVCLWEEESFEDVDMKNSRLLASSSI